MFQILKFDIIVATHQRQWVSLHWAPNADSFFQWRMKAYNKETVKDLHHWPCLLGIDGFPAQRTNNAKRNVCSCHDVIKSKTCIQSCSLWCINKIGESVCYQFSTRGSMFYPLEAPRNDNNHFVKMQLKTPYHRINCFFLYIQCSLA